jgi:uncharacterized membrane protein
VTIFLAGVPASGLFDNVNGLPAHPLIVHGALGLIMLASIGGVLSVVPRWRGWLLPASAVVSVLAAASAVAAGASGESLQHRLAQTDLIRAHAEAGEMSRNVALLLMVVVVAWWAVERSLARSGAGARVFVGVDGPGAAVRPAAAPSRLRTVALVLAGLTVVVSLASAGALAVAGDRGARAVWQNTPTQSASGQGEG